MAALTFVVLVVATLIPTVINTLNDRSKTRIENILLGLIGVITFVLQINGSFDASRALATTFVILNVLIGTYFLVKNTNALVNYSTKLEKLEIAMESNRK